MPHRHFHPAWAIVVMMHSHIYRFNETSKNKHTVEKSCAGVRLAMQRDKSMTGITAFAAVQMPVAFRWASWCKHSGNDRLHNECAYTTAVCGGKTMPCSPRWEVFYSVHHMFAVQCIAAQHQAPMHAYEWSTSCLHRGHSVVELSLHTLATATKSAVQEAAEAAAALAILRLELLLRWGPLRPVQASLESSFSVFFILLPQAWHRCEQALRHGSASLKESGQSSCATEVVRRRARGQTSALRQHPAVRAPQQGAQLAGLSGGRAG